MLVSCPKCESRYKLPDEKIRPTGTKVRCPRCQHTFHVFREEKPVPRPETASPPVYDEPYDSDFVEGAKTMISPPAKLQKESGVKEPSPFKKVSQVSEPPPSLVKEPSRVKNPNRLNEAVPLEDESTEFFERDDPIDEAIEQGGEQPPLRPFGDATFAEIQKSGGKPTQNRKWISVLALVAVISGLATFLIKSTKKNVETASVAVPAPAPLASPGLVTPKKNPNWYQDDPVFFQDYLAQMATLPPVEQQKPENRSLLAEALISNGMMSGADDQVISGMSIASGLLIAHPSEIYGFLGLAALSTWKEDLLTLSDLLKRWPASAQNSTEYKLVKALVDSQNDHPQESLETLRGILLEYPTYFRAEMWALLISLEHWKVGEQVFGAQKLQDMTKNFEKRRALIRSGGSVPTVYVSIERRLAKRSSSVAEAVTKKPKEVVKKIINPNSAKPPKEAAASLKPPEVAAPKTATKSAKKTLPKADPSLLALNKQASKSKQTAAKLYQEGNQKQRDNRIDEAITLYQSALREDPDLADVYKQLGVIYMNRQERERALRAFKIYLQLKPESDDRQAVLGWINSMQ